MKPGAAFSSTCRDSMPGIHAVAKPVGPVCNIQCNYCFHLEKQALFRAPYTYTGKIDKVTIDLKQMTQAVVTEEKRRRGDAAHKKAMSD